MSDSDDRPEPERETVALGGETGQGPLARLIARLSPRSLSSIAVGSAVLLAAVVIGFVVNDDEDDAAAESAAPIRHSAPSASTPPADPEPPSAPGGGVWVGYRGLMVAVPARWVDVPRQCKFAFAGPPSALIRARCSPEGAATTTTIVWLHQPVRFGSSGSPSTDAAVEGGVVVGDVRRDGVTFSQSVGVPSDDTVVVIRATRRGKLDRLVASARPIPVGWVTLPDLVGTDPQKSIRRIAQLGLVPRVNHNSGTVLPAATIVVDQSLAEGRVVAPGTRVAFSVLPAGAR